MFCWLSPTNTCATEKPLWTKAKAETGFLYTWATWTPQSSDMRWDNQKQRWRQKILSYIDACKCISYRHQKHLRAWKTIVDNWRRTGRFCFSCIHGPRQRPNPRIFNRLTNRKQLYRNTLYRKYDSIANILKSARSQYRSTNPHIQAPMKVQDKPTTVIFIFNTCLH